jgi:hypothetical protein
MCRLTLAWLFALQLPAYGQVTRPTTLIVEGTVTDAVTGTPLAGARVKLCGSVPSEIYTRADSAGKYRFTAPFPGSYWVDAEQPGFLTPAESRTHFNVDRSAIGPDGNMHAFVPIPLTAYAVVAGRLNSPDGLPLQNYPVLLSGNRPAGGSTRTNDRGEFRFGRVVPGTYSLFVLMDSDPTGLADPAYRPTYYPHALDPASAKPLQLAPGQHFTADMEILRQAGVRVAGLITGPGTALLEMKNIYTHVILLPAETQGSPSKRLFGTVTEGRFEIKDALPGKYELMLYAGQFGLDGKLLFGQSKSIEVGRQDVEQLTIPLERLPEIPGVVTCEQGCPAAPVYISVGTHDFPRVQATSAADGTFALPAMFPGHAVIDPLPGLISATLNGRDILKVGFDYPPAGGATLRLTMSCGNVGRRQ